MGSLLLLLLQKTALVPTAAVAAAAAAAAVVVVVVVVVLALAHEVPSESCPGWPGQHTCPLLSDAVRWLVGRWNRNHWWLAAGLMIEKKVTHVSTCLLHNCTYSRVQNKVSLTVPLHNRATVQSFSGTVQNGIATVITVLCNTPFCFADSSVCHIDHAPQTS